MNESVIKLVDAIRSGDATTTEDAFAAAMAEKLAPKIDEYRQQVAANMFKPAEEEIVEEEVQLTQEEYDALSEEEKQEFVLDEGLGKFIGKVAKGAAKAVGATIGAAAKTAGAIRQTAPAVRDAYNKGRMGAQKAIAG